MKATPIAVGTPIPHFEGFFSNVRSISFSDRLKNREIKRLLVAIPKRERKRLRVSAFGMDLSHKEDV